MTLKEVSSGIWVSLLLTLQVVTYELGHLHRVVSVCTPAKDLSDSIKNTPCPPNLFEKKTRYHTMFLVM